jgi:glycosyltransferase involved in cell wall biosynthesis
MKNENCISVVIPYYNRHETINESIQSVLKQSLLPNEIIIVDDGSEESSFEFLNKEYDTHALIRIIKKKNGGVSSARNVGLTEAKGKYIALLDSDDYWAPTHLEKSIKLFCKFPQIVVTHSRFECIFTGCDNNQYLVNKIASRLLPWTYNAVNKDGGQNGYYIEKKCASALLIKAEVAFATSSIVIDTENLRRKVFFDVSLPFGEDVDFMSALALQGGVGYLDDIGSYYRIHQDNTVNIDKSLTKDSEAQRIKKLRSIEKRIIYSQNPKIKSNLINELSKRYYLIAQSLSDKKNYKRALEWYLLSFKLNANKASLKHIVVQKLLPDIFANYLYKE